MLFLGTTIIRGSEANQHSCSVIIKARVPGANSGIEGYVNDFVISGRDMEPSATYRVELIRDNLLWAIPQPPKTLTTTTADSNGQVSFSVNPGEEETYSEGNRKLRVLKREGNREIGICEQTYRIGRPHLGCQVSRDITEPGVNQTVTFHLNNIPERIFLPGTGPFGIKSGNLAATASGPGKPQVFFDRVNDTITASNFTSVGTHRIGLEFQGTRKVVACQDTISVRAQPGNQSPTQPGQSNPSIEPSKPKFCGEQNQGIQTALGCIPLGDYNSFGAWVLRWAIGIGGGVAFLLIVTSAFQIITAGNNPQQLQGGRELLTAAISGLILIIFSVFLLRLIGVQILNIPGFG